MPRAKEIFLRALSSPRSRLGNQSQSYTEEDILEAQIDVPWSM
jgi:hypothetical protein